MAQIIMRGTPIQFMDRDTLGTILAGELSPFVASDQSPRHPPDGNSLGEAVGMDEMTVPSLDTARLGTRR